MSEGVGRWNNSNYSRFMSVFAFVYDFVLLLFLVCLVVSHQRNDGKMEHLGAQASLSRCSRDTRTAIIKEAKFVKK